MKSILDILKKRSVFRKLSFKKFNYKFSNNNNNGDFDLGLEPDNPLVPIDPKNGPKILFNKKELEQ
jgi:hypothetical protein